MAYYRRRRTGYRRSGGYRRNYTRRSYSRPRRTFRRAAIPHIGIPSIKKAKFVTVLNEPFRFWVGGASNERKWFEWGWHVTANSLFAPFNGMFSDETYNNPDKPAGIQEYGRLYTYAKVYFAVLQVTVATQDVHRDFAIGHSTDLDKGTVENTKLDELAEMPGWTKIAKVPAHSKATRTFTITIPTVSDVDPETMRCKWNSDSSSWDNPTWKEYFNINWAGQYVRKTFTGSEAETQNTTAINAEYGDVQVTMRLTQYVEFSERNPMIQ